MGSYDLSALDALLRHVYYKAQKPPRRTCPKILEEPCESIIVDRPFWRPTFLQPATLRCAYGERETALIGPERYASAASTCCLAVWRVLPRAMETMGSYFRRS